MVELGSRTWCICEDAVDVFPCLGCHFLVEHFSLDSTVGTETRDLRLDG
jgi:hypothetical protein